MSKKEEEKKNTFIACQMPPIESTALLLSCSRCQMQFHVSLSPGSFATRFVKRRETQKIRRALEFLMSVHGRKRDERPHQIHRGHCLTPKKWIRFALDHSSLDPITKRCTPSDDATNTGEQSLCELSKRGNLLTARTIAKVKQQILLGNHP